MNNNHVCLNHIHACKNHTHSCQYHTRACQNHTLRGEITPCVWKSHSAYWMNPYLCLSKSHSACVNHTHACLNHTRACVLKIEQIFVNICFYIYTHACDFHKQTCHFHTFACRLFSTHIFSYWANFSSNWTQLKIFMWNHRFYSWQLCALLFQQ
jgi:hypothetical protein